MSTEGVHFPQGFISVCWTVRGCIQKFPDWVDNEINNTRWEATQRVMAAKLTRVTHKISIQLHLVAENYTICSYRSRRPVRKLLDTPSNVGCGGPTREKLAVVDDGRFLLASSISGDGGRYAPRDRVTGTQRGNILRPSPQHMPPRNFKRFARHWNEPALWFPLGSYSTRLLRYYVLYHSIAFKQFYFSLRSRYSTTFLLIFHFPFIVLLLPLVILVLFFLIIIILLFLFPLLSYSFPSYGLVPLKPIPRFASYIHLSVYF
jgi:hypothetical protein